MSDALSQCMRNYLRIVRNSFTGFLFVLGSLSISLGLFLTVISAYPQLALASPPAPGFGGPNEGQTGVPKDAPIDRFFDQALDPTTPTTSTIILKANTGNTQTGAVTGSNLCTSVTVAPDFGGNANRKITCVHSTLTDSTWYTYRITTGVTNVSAQGLSSDFVVHFQTGSFTAGAFTGGATFAPPPIITGTVPGPGGTLPTNAKLIVTFNPGGLNPNTSTMATSGAGSVLSASNVQLFAQVNGVSSGANLITASNISWNPATKQMTVTPTGLLTAANLYVLVIKSTVQNTDTNVLMGPDFMVPFKAIAADTTAPTVSAMFPADASTGADRATSDIGVAFNKALDASTVSSSTVQLIFDANNDATLNEATTTPAQLFLDADERTIHVSPLPILGVSARYFVKIVSGVSGVKDQIGNALGADIVKSFSTGTNINGAVAPDTAKPTILFATGNNFQISVTFSEPMNATSTPVASNFTLESPVGTPVSLGSAFFEYQAFSKTVFIRGLAIAPGQNFKITVATSTIDLSGNGMDNTGTPAKNTFQGTLGNATQGGTPGGGPGGGSGGGQVDFFTFGTNPIRVMPDSPVAGATSQYRVEFQATQAIPSGGSIVLTFPTGFSFAATCGTKLDQFDNNDINGPSPNTVTFTPVCSSTARTVTLTTASGATNPNDFLRLKLQGIINSSVPKDFSTGGYTVDIKTFDTSNSLLDSKTSMPFFFSTPGSQSIAGFVFNDTNSNNTKDAGETGVASMNVCLGGPSVGWNCTTTDGTGAFTFSSLNDGFYHVEVPPITSGGGSTVGGFMFRDINLSSGSSASAINFGLKAADGTITVSVTGGPASKKVDVMAFNPYDPSKGGSTVREVTLNGSGAGSASLPVSFGKWQVNVGPWLPKTPGVPPPPPIFDFLPPQAQEVNVTASASTPSITVALIASNRTIQGIVVDGSGTGIPNVFINARPTSATGGNNQTSGAFTQSRSDGTFSLSAINGTYIIEANIPGMPSAAPNEVTVADNSSNVDGNLTADVYSNGSLVTGTGITLKILKSGQSISGRVLDDSGNAVAFAFVKAESLDASSNFTGLFAGSPTDSSGNYTLYVANGTWRLRAFAPGFGDLGTLTVTVSGSSLTSQNFQPTTASFGTVSGTVTVGGTAQAGAFINMYGASGGNGTVSGSDGTYSLKVKTGAGYTIEGFIPGKGPLAPITSVTVGASGLTGQNLSLAGTGTINVTITGITDAFVDARDVNGRGFGTGSQTSGVYSLTMPASTAGIIYTVKAGNPKYGLIGSQSVTLASNGTQTVSFSPPTLSTVSGTVSSTSSACVAGVSVFFSDATDGRRAGATTSATGTYSIQLPNGTYSLIASIPGCVDNANPSNITVSGANVSTGTNRTMVFADATITGRVTLSGSNATTATKIFADNGSGKFVAADLDITATSGNNYTLSVTAGAWTVKARSDGFESSSASVTATSGGIATQNLTLSAISGYTIKESRSSNIKPSQGGLVKNTDIGSNFTVNIPAGIFGTSGNDASVSTKEKTSIIDPPTDNIVVLGGKAIEITPTDASGNKITSLSSNSGASVTVTIPYSTSDIPSGVSESKLVLGVWSSEKQVWEALSTNVDTTNHALTATVTHFSDFAPIAPVGGSSAPSAPGSISVGSPGVNSLLISWQSVSGATGYNLYSDTSSGGSFPKLTTITSGSTTSYTDASLSCNTTQYYKVSATNDSGESAATSAASATTNACVAGGSGGGIAPSSGASSYTPPSTSSTTTQQTTTAQPTVSPQTPVPSTIGQSSSGISALVEGALLKAVDSANVFIVKAGKLVRIPNIKAFTALSLNWTSIKEIASADLALAKEATLQKAKGSSTVYIVRDGKKLALASKKALTNAGYSSQDVVEVPKAIITQMPTMKFVREKDTPQVFAIERAKLRLIKTPKALKRLKVKESDITNISTQDIAAFAKGKDIK